MTPTYVETLELIETREMYEPIGGIVRLSCISRSDKIVVSRSSNLPAICYGTFSYIKELEAIIQVAAESVKLNGIRVLLSQRPRGG